MLSFTALTNMAKEIGLGVRPEKLRTGKQQGQK